MKYDSTITSDSWYSINSAKKVAARYQCDTDVGAPQSLTFRRATHSRHHGVCPLKTAAILATFETKSSRKKEH